MPKNPHTILTTANIAAFLASGQLAWNPSTSKIGLGHTDITENGGPVGGVNDGDMPDLSNISGTYVQAEIVALRDAIRELAAKINAMNG